MFFCFHFIVLCFLNNNNKKSFFFFFSLGKSPQIKTRQIIENVSFYFIHPIDKRKITLSSTLHNLFVHDLDFEIGKYITVELVSQQKYHNPKRLLYGLATSSLLMRASFREGLSRLNTHSHKATKNQWNYLTAIIIYHYLQSIPSAIKYTHKALDIDSSHEDLNLVFEWITFSFSLPFVPISFI